MRTFVPPDLMNPVWGPYENTVRSWIEKSEKQDLVRRIWSKEPALWTQDAAAQKEVASRLGWLSLPVTMKEKTAELSAFAEEIKKEGFTKVLLLGMGGSSLAPEVIQKVFGNKSGYPELLVLDSTDPIKICDTEGALDLQKTLFIVSSKSGGTIELVSLFKYFFEKVKAVNPAAAGSQFVAVTDPNTTLAESAKKNAFRKIFLAPPDVGGRFSALTYFGLVPAALIGVDTARLLEEAAQAAEKISVDFDIEDNPAVPLGVAMAVLAEEGRDKLTIVSDDAALSSFADWAEQLVAESSGKEELGIIPVTHEPVERPGHYSNDRFFVALTQTADESSDFFKKMQALRDAEHPVLVLGMKDKYALGAEFFRWEFATALACALLKVNAFDQPDVQSAKDGTKALLKKMEAGETVPVPKAGTDLADFWGGLNDGDYIGILAFLPDRPDLRQALRVFQAELKNVTHKAVTLGFGPRYLHSTGQLHKGGPNTGVFIILTARHAQELAIPGEKYGFRGLEWAQAVGDLEALKSKGRRVAHFELDDLSEESLKNLSAVITGSVRARD